MLSNCLIPYKPQHSYGDIQSLSMSSESFNPGQTQQAHQQESVSKESPRNMTMDRHDTETEGNTTALLVLGVAMSSARIYLLCSMMSNRI